MTRGRPKIEIDTSQFINLCSFQCTLEEIASWFKCSDDTIERWCKRELGVNFAEAYKKYSAGGKISLRRWQFKMAEHNCSMAIWLGKQYLGQKEQTELSISANDDETVKAMSDYFESRKKQEVNTNG